MFRTGESGRLDKYNVQVIGVQVDARSAGEDRIEFKHTMDQAPGIEMARSEVHYSVDEGACDRRQTCLSGRTASAYTMAVQAAVSYTT